MKLKPAFAAWQSALWPLVRREFEDTLVTTSPARVAADLLPHVKQLVDPKLHGTLANVLGELASQLALDRYRP